MKAMKTALKNHMGKTKHSPEISVDHTDKPGVKMPQEEKDETDLAPALHAESGAQHSAMDMGGGELGPEHIPLLEQLIEHLKGQGRGAMGLEERAGGIAQEKLGAIHAHQKKMI